MNHDKRLSMKSIDLRVESKGFILASRTMRVWALFPPCPHENHSWQFLALHTGSDLKGLAGRSFIPLNLTALLVSEVGSPLEATL